MTKGYPRIFHGWWIVLACMLCISTGTGPFAFASLGLFMLPLTGEFGWTRAQVSLCTTILVATTAVSVPVIGRIVDEVGSRRILVFSILSMAACLAAIPALVSELWHLALIFVLIGTLSAGTNSVPYMPILSTWFDRHRGLAIGLSIAGIGLGYAYVPLVVQFMIDHAGWRSGYYALSVIELAVAIPLVLFVLRESPAELGLKPDGADTATVPKAAQRDVGLRIPETLRRPEFWMMVVIFVTLSFVLNGMLAHLVPMLIDRGMEPAGAAAVASAEGFTVFISRIFIGFLIDRIFAPRVATVFFTLSAAGLGMFALGATDLSAFTAAVLIGLSLGAEIDILAYLASRYFGLRSYGAVYGLLFAAVLAGTATGPYVFGLGFDATGSYDRILVICVVINVFAVLLTSLLGPFPDWERPAGAEVSARAEPPTPGS
jgi:MFS family permease